MTTQEIDNKLAALNGFLLKDYRKDGFTRDMSITFEHGRKFTRIVRSNEGTNRTCYGFINIENGDVYRAAGWNAPEPKRHVRGNINDESTWETWFTWSGIKYLR